MSTPNATASQPTRKTSKKSVSCLQDISQARTRLGLNQTDFWARFGVTQSGGSRYEAGRFIPVPLGILLALDELGHVTEEQMLIALKAASHSTICRAKNRGSESAPKAKMPKKSITSLENAHAARRRMGVNQTDYWSRYGVTQSGGSRYESGRSIPASTGMLMALDELGFITDEQLEEAHKAVKKSTICKGNG